MSRRNEKLDLLGVVMREVLFAWIIPVPCLVWQRVQAHPFYCSALLCFKNSAFFFLNKSEGLWQPRVIR